LQIELRLAGSTRIELSVSAAAGNPVYAGFINGECIAMDGGASLVEGGGGTVQYLQAWGPEQWEEFRTRAARTVASQSEKA